jgi:hypothetical protein
LFLSEGVFPWLDIKKYQLMSEFLSEETSEGGVNLVQNARI